MTDALGRPQAAGEEAPGPYAWAGMLGPLARGGMGDPVAVAVAPAGDVVYVASRHPAGVTRWAPDGRPLGALDAGAAGAAGAAKLCSSPGPVSSQRSVTITTEAVGGAAHTPLPPSICRRSGGTATVRPRREARPTRPSAGAPISPCTGPVGVGRGERGEGRGAERCPAPSSCCG